MENVMAPAGDKTSVLIISAGFNYCMQDACRVGGSFTWQQDITHNRSAYKVSLGVSINPLDVDWSNLF